MLFDDLLANTIISFHDTCNADANWVGDELGIRTEFGDTSNLIIAAIRFYGLRKILRAALM